MSSICHGQRLDERRKARYAGVLASVSQHYPIRVVSRMTGLSVDTLRAWERRYKAVTPARSARGRTYDDADVRRLVRLRNILKNGYSIGEVGGLTDEDLAQLLEKPIRDSVARNPASAPPTGLDAVLNAIESFDGARANEELGRMAALLSPVEFIHEVALPLMREVGDRWHAGTMQAAQEHLATESVRNVLGAMARLNRAEGVQPKLLATTPAGELHDLGILAGAVIAGGRGFQVACLGPNLPALEILFAIQRFSPQILLMGLTTPTPPRIAIEALIEVLAQLPAGVQLWLGGSGGLAALEEMGNPPEIAYVSDLKTMEGMLADYRARYVA